MSTELKQEKTGEFSRRKPLRLWPGVLIVALQWLIWFSIPIILPEFLIYRVFAGLTGWLAVVVWWGFFSRAIWFERWGAVVLMIAALFVTSLFIHESIAVLGQGMMFFIAIPFLSLAFVVVTIITCRLPDMVRRTIMAAAILLSCGVWIMVRSDGISGNFTPLLTWRWIQTTEEQLLTGADEKTTAVPEVTGYKTRWPGFRGPNRDSIIHGLQINTDWSVSPPVEMWRSPIGPGCSSFAVLGHLLYTQEQRGEYEMVSCYELKTGKLVWKHGDKARFYDSHAGAGPRSTPTIADGRVYTLGATGILNVLDAGDGSVIWSRNAASDTGVKILTWGFTGSPLVVDDIVIVALSGQLAAYDAESGKPLWFGPHNGDSFSSPHLLTIDGISQVLLMSAAGAVSIEPTSGRELWMYSCPMNGILQPALIASGNLLLSTEVDTGIRRIAVTHNQGIWDIKELWTSNEMRLNFNDFIIHKGYAYGFDNPRIACIDIKDGKRRWKGNRYRGFTLLLADQDLLLVLSEKGELALVPAIPDEFKELAKIQAVKGKTWNHPVLADDIVVVRNSQEMAAFRLPLKIK